jgi:O-antigen/teichoic acid export membrane protein
MSATPIAGRAVWFFASNVANAGISFLTMILLARVLSPVEYGVLAIFFTFSAVLTSFVGLALDGSVSIAYFKRTTEELRLHVSSSIVLIAMVFAGLASVVVLFAAPLTSWLHLTLEWLLLGMVCATAQAIVNIKLALWMVKGAATRYAIFQIGQGVMLAGLTAVMIFGAAMGWESRAWALVVTTFLFGCGSVFMMVKDGECSRKISMAEMRLALRFGVPLIPHICGALLFTSADRFVVNGLLGAAATGLYQLAAQIGSIVMVATDAINKAFSPWLYRHLGEATDAARRNIVKLTYSYFAVALTVSTLFFIAPWNLASIFGGVNYSEAGLLVPFFILGHCIGGMYFMVVNYIFYTGRTGYLSAATLMSGLIGIGAGYVLVGQVGLLGAGIAFVISKLLHFLTTWVISARIFPMPWLLQQSSHQEATC